MDDWHKRLARTLVAETPAGFQPDAAAALEIAFGQARSALTYALELARAHRIPASGSVSGDDVWLQLGGARVHFPHTRRAGHIVARRAGHDEAILQADADVKAAAQDAIDALVVAWRSGPTPAGDRLARPTDFDDEPTKG